MSNLYRQGFGQPADFLTLKLLTLNKVGVQDDKSTVMGKPTTFTGSLHELVKEFHTAKVLSMPGQWKVMRSFIPDQ